MCSRLFIALLLYMCTSTMAEFAEIPMSVVVELGTAIPPCRCRHMSSIVLVTWRVNNSSVGQFPNIRSGSVNESGNIVHTLTIPAEPQYNGTVVECVAVFFDGSPNEVTPAATILFTPTNLPTIVPASFELVPSPLTVAVEQGTATFQCQHLLAGVISWRVNGMLLNTAANFSNISAVSFAGGNGVTTHILSIGTLLVYNGATIECVAAFIDGSSPQYTAPVPLFIQDTPKKVKNTTCQRNYSKDELLTLWNPLPTLDINDTDPDIVYSVELYQITCGQNIFINRTVVAGNNVTEEGLDLMQIYKAVIAARNNVAEARNGPSVEMKEKFMSLNGPTLFNLMRNSRINFQSDAPVPSYYVLTLESLDGHKDNLVNINITVERNGEMIDMHVDGTVPPNSLWRASILPYGCENDTTVTNYELSTHDIQNVTVVASSSLPGQIRVTGDIIGGSATTGVFLVVYSLTNYSDVQYNIIVKQTEENSISLDVTGLTGSEYGVSMFALKNGLPFPRVVASPKNIAILNSHQGRAPPQQQPPQQQPPLIEYDLIRMSSGVCITCTFLDSSTTDCVAVVHRRISQLSSSGLMNIESSHKFTRSGDTARGCIEGVNMELYQVGIVGGKMVMESNSNKKEYSKAGAITAGIVPGVIVFALIAAVAVLFIVMCTRWKKRHKTTALEPVYSEVTPHSRSQAETVVNIESGSAAGYNHYVESAQLSERSPEEQPLLTPPVPPRLTTDCVSTPPALDHESLEASLQPLENSTSPPDPVTLDSGASDPTYTQPMLTRSLNTVPPPASTEKVPYEDIQRFQNQQGQHYALPQLETTSKRGALDDLHQVVYIKVKPHAMTQNGDQDIDPTSDHAVTPPEPAAVHEPLTTELFFSILLPHSSKWQSLGEALSFDEDRLDEIYTNYVTDEDCLREMLEVYMLRSDLNHSWEEIEAALEKIGTSCDVSRSVQEISSSPYSPRISGRIIHLPATAANHHDEEVHVAIEEPVDAIHSVDQQGIESHNISGQSSVDKQPASKEDSDHEEQGGSSDSGYSGSQQSESESSDNGVLLESEDDSRELSQASSEEQSETSEKDRPTLNLSISLLENLDDYESGLVASLGSQVTLTGDGNDDSEFDRTTEERLPMPVPSSPINPCFSAHQNCLQVEGFCEKTEDQSNDDLCKISPVHCQDSHTHKNYKEALMHQMRLQVGQNLTDKLEYNNAVEESSLVHTGNEDLDGQPVQHVSKLSNKRHVNQISNFCIPTISVDATALDINKVHDLVTVLFCVLKLLPSIGT